MRHFQRVLVNKYTAAKSPEYLEYYHTVCDGVQTLANHLSELRHYPSLKINGATGKDSISQWYDDLIDLRVRAYFLCYLLLVLILETVGPTCWGSRPRFHRFQWIVQAWPRFYSNLRPGEFCMCSFQVSGVRLLITSNRPSPLARAVVVPPILRASGSSANSWTTLWMSNPFVFQLIVHIIIPEFHSL